MVWLLLAVAALVVTAAAAAAALGVRSPSAYALAIYLFASAEIVLLTEVLSFGSLVGAAGYAVGEGVLLAAALAAWHLRGRPRPPLPRLDLRAAVRAHPVLAFLGAIVAGAFVYQAFIVFATPPNNWDSMTYHLPRAVEWLQRGAVEYIESPPSERLNSFQPNSEIEILYTFAFAGRDTAASATQLLAELALMLGVYGCARRLGFARAPSAFAGLLAATPTLVALQTVTTQNDLLAASFVVAAACLALGRDRRELALAGLAVGLALGTKLTAGAALPLIALLALSRPPRVHRLTTLAAAGAAGFALVGAYGYVLNTAETGRALGEPSARGGADVGAVTFSGTLSNVARVSWRFIDVSGYHTPRGFESWIGARGRGVFSALGIDTNPPEATQTDFGFEVNNRPFDGAFFGPFGFLLLPALALGFLVAAALRRAPPPTAVFALSLPVFVFSIALAFRYNLWLGRFLIAPVAMTLVLAAVLYRRRVIAGLVALVGALTLGLAHAYNAAAPTGLEQPKAIWNMPRAQAQSILRKDMRPVIEAVAHYVPTDGRIGYVIGFDDWSYPLYGPALDRTLVALPPENTLEAAERLDTDWVFLARDVPRPPARRNWSQIDFPLSGWVLLTYPEEL